MSDNARDGGEPPKEVIIYSGGMDSYTLLCERRHEGADVHALSFFYGQRHKKELDAARYVCDSYRVDHHVVQLGALNELLQGSALTSDSIEVPEGHYTEPSMKQTVVPNRNMIMLSIAIGYAVSIGAEAVYTAVHAGDHAIYPDCRPQFIEMMNQLAGIANYHPVKVLAPYLRLSKGDILSLGLSVPLTDYGLTWTCYKGEALACGKCGACVERLEAFAQNSVKDPILYAAATA